MRLTDVTEGKTDLLVPDLEPFKDENFPSMGPAVFYNPQMEFCRTVSVCALHAFAKEVRKPTVCDVLAASGARGLRYANEVGCRLTLNDHNPVAVGLARQNVERLGLNVEVSHRDANVLLSERRFDVVDVDPFGTPAPFLDSAARSAKEFLMVTATDTAVLCGVYPKAAKRLYGAKTWRGDCVHEVALRILLAKIAKVLALHEKAMEPVMVQSSDHYLRVFVKVAKGATRANGCLDKIGPLYHCSKCHEHNLDAREHCGAPYAEYGPLWTGKLFDPAFCKAAKRKARSYDKRVQRFFDLMVEEAQGPELYYDLHKVASWAGTSAPNTDRLITRLRRAGVRATKTHMASPALRVNCSLERLETIMSRL